MRLINYLDTGRETLGVVGPDGRVRAVRHLDASAPATMAELIAAGPDGLATLRKAIDSSAADETAVAWNELDLLPAVPAPRNVICVGRNYREHADEEGVDTPERPEIFLKHTASVVAHGAPISWDATLTGQVDYEAELAVVIGSPARNVGADAALDHVLGYTCLNDVSARDLQFNDLQWARGKSLDTFCPIGPWVVTADEIADPQDLTVRCTVDGEVLQEASTADMYHSVAEVIEHCSRAFTLLPGDVIATGTPGGVGVFREPPRLLLDGHQVVVEIDGVGRLENRCVVTGR